MGILKIRRLLKQQKSFTDFREISDTIFVNNLDGTSPDSVKKLHIVRQIHHKFCDNIQLIATVILSYSL